MAKPADNTGNSSRPDAARLLDRFIRLISGSLDFRSSEDFLAPARLEKQTLFLADRSNMENSSLLSEFHCHNGAHRPRANLFDFLDFRARRFSCRPSKRIEQSQFFWPNKIEKITQFDSRAFCAKFSSDGDYYLVATQDQHVRIFGVSHGALVKDVEARGVGWSILDSDFSSDSKWIIYSTWSNSVQLANVSGDFELHEALDFQPGARRFGLFSIKFSQDNREILGGASDGRLYLYDIERKQRILSLPAHTDDINSVCFGDENSQILVSAGDDTACRVWDRRIISTENEARQPCVGQFIGNCEGICHVEGRGDGRYFLTSGKDQTIRLWDLRQLKPDSAETLEKYRVPGWDYRWEMYQGIPPEAAALDGAVMKFRGHRVLETLIRAHFSPAFSTGQRFLYTGSQSGTIFFYDILTGETVQQLTGHGATVRDVSWHPTLPKLLSASWDQTVGIWRMNKIATMGGNNQTDEQTEEIIG